MTEADSNRDDRSADELLVVRCQLGERPAFDALVVRWHDALWRYLRRLANDDDTARDLAQDTWLRVFRGIARLRAAEAFRAWLFGIARRVAMDRLRAQYAAPRTVDVEFDTLAAEFESAANFEAEIATLESNVAALPIVERETLTLFHLRELSLDEIAALMRVPLGTVKSRLFRARRLLRDLYQKEQP